MSKLKEVLCDFCGEPVPLTYEEGDGFCSEECRQSEEDDLRESTLSLEEKLVEVEEHFDKDGNRTKVVANGIDLFPQTALETGNGLEYYSQFRFRRNKS